MFSINILRIDIYEPISVIDTPQERPIHIFHEEVDTSWTGYVFCKKRKFWLSAICNGESQIQGRELRNLREILSSTSVREGVIDIIYLNKITNKWHVIIFQTILKKNTKGKCIILSA